MSVSIGAEPLRGDLVRLEPLTEGHVPGLALAAEEDRSAYGYTMVPTVGETAAYVKAQMTREGVTPFAQVRVGDEAPVGCTTYCNPWSGNASTGHRRVASLPCAHTANRNKDTLTCMNPPEKITPEHAQRLVALLGMMGDLDRDGLAFLVGHMASKNIDLAIEAFGALMTTQLPLEDH